MVAIEWDVFSLPPNGSADPPTYLATLYDAREKRIRVEHKGTGSGSFAINRTSPEVSETVLAKGNLVKVRVPEIHSDYLFAFFLETGDFTLVSSDEAGGEMLRFGGRGNLCYLECARNWNVSFTGGSNPRDGVWRAYAFGGGNAPGQILTRMLAEMQDPDHPYPALPLLTTDFNTTVNSAGTAWSTTNATEEFSYKVGDDGLAVATLLADMDVMALRMSPGFLLQAFNEPYGRDLSATVRFAKGLNVVAELQRAWVGPSVPETVMLVSGETDNYAVAVGINATSKVTKHGFMTSFGTSATALIGQGETELVKRAKATELIMFQIANRRTEVQLTAPITVGSIIGPDASTGFYLPGPTGTNGDFWVGDIVTLNTGSGPFDFNEALMRVLAISITRDDDNHELIIIPELEPAPVLGLHQVILTSQGNCGVAEYGPLPGDGTPRQLIFGGAFSGMSLGTPSIAVDTDGYAVRINDPLADKDVGDPFGPPAYAKQIIIPNGLGGLYRYAWEGLNTVGIGNPYYTGSIARIYNPADIHGNPYPYLPQAQDTGIGAAMQQQWGRAVISLLVNGVVKASVSVPPGAVDYTNGASHKVGHIRLDDGDSVTMQASANGIYWAQLVSSIGISVFGAQQGGFILTRMSD